MLSDKKMIFLKIIDTYVLIFQLKCINFVVGDQVWNKCSNIMTPYHTPTGFAKISLLTLHVYNNIFINNIHFFRLRVKNNNQAHIQGDLAVMASSLN